MTDREDNGVREAIDYWNAEALIAEEQGDEEQAAKYFKKVEALFRLLANVTATAKTAECGADAAAASRPSPDVT